MKFLFGYGRRRNYTTYNVAHRTEDSSTARCGKTPQGQLCVLGVVPFGYTVCRDCERHD